MRKAISRQEPTRALSAENVVVLFLALIIVLSFCRRFSAVHGGLTTAEVEDYPCDDVYIVGEGETLKSIMEKCEDPFIVENNPFIDGPDDEVFPGLVIKSSLHGDMSA
ncbi:hypothetical protein DH2020_039854 [Rehmannia glutinosa]|uniref:LysM domain-containing protein n=1 Tax=Rehmannia glutinosa TaxID=99300 RepID=A0ABR0UVT2_REHGL